MKKTLVSALTTALVVGAASTTFAAANPFSDVPADHWAYDAVSQLAADGVIEGYGDTTFRGNQNITRYEMAQMIAKAMAKSDVSAADKALIDKLAAEFSDELNNLGVRVSNLERNADMVKWNGMARYTYTHDKYEYKDLEGKDKNNELLFRLEPSAEVNDHWHVKARLEAKTDLKSDQGNDGKVSLKRIWAQGDYSNFQVKLGKLPSTVNNTLVYDNPYSGAAVTFGKNLKATLEAGRVGTDELSNTLNGKGVRGTITKAILDDDYPIDKAASYQGIGLAYNDGSKLTGRAGYQHFDWNADDVDNDDVGIWSVGANYRFDKNVAFDASYAKSNRSLTDYYKDLKGDDNQDKSYAFELDYKGAQKQNVGTWGAWVAYRYLGALTSVKPTYDGIHEGYKGWEVGMNYTPFQNVVGTLRYGDTKNLYENDLKDKVFFGRIEVFF
ncbi:S-layer protein [Mitsuokella sp. AF33-22]|uniref:S-layer homology domain-containing protein n=1 Tax=Mitsuokella sp. AF33-22 TaxID=2292047 RepID=UPI000E49DFBF|nr:S-layer homology domain-containing protein [Mitsuokella sp. AF33-22]RHM57086.1 S-layer protein [Mitsuokella sp. AF33-22]